MEYKTLEELCLSASKGYPKVCVNKEKIEVIKKEIRNQSKIENKRYLKVLNLREVKALIEESEVECAYAEFEQKYQKDIIYIEKNDIVVTIATGLGKFNILYIENEPTDKYTYNNSCFVIKANEDIISSKYIYLQLMTNRIQEQLLKKAKGTKIKHITKKDLLSIEIPVLDTKEMEKICSRYDELRGKERKVKQEQQEFWNNLDKI